MSLKPFELQYVGEPGEAEPFHEVVLRGFFDTNTVAEFDEMAEKVLDSKSHRLILDLLQLNYVSSAGLGAIMALLQQLRRKGGDMVLVQPTPRVYRVLEMLGFMDILDVAPNRSAAIQILTHATNS